MAERCTVCTLPEHIHRLVDVRGRSFCDGQLRTPHSTDNVPDDTHCQEATMESDTTSNDTGGETEAPAAAPDVEVNTEGGDATVETGGDTGGESAESAAAGDEEPGSSEDE